VVAIKKLFDDWKDVLSRYANITFLHNLDILYYCFAKNHANTVPNLREAASAIGQTPPLIHK
jgi:hypothetical protein